MTGGKLSVFAAVLTLTALNVSARAVNISNTWVLPEEGFPVFYRYFRDRISWNEADAVCQFHHGNLVTVDTSLKYDAVRAYLKELDITDNVWIGLSKPVDKSDFVWRDFSTLGLLVYWEEALPTGNDALCAAVDPAADFRWHALTCGEPAVASFICELPLPSWANGCLVTQLPSLTILYIPEKSAIELTSDCGLDGTKRIVCKGNMDREDMMRHLTCTDSSEIIDDKTQVSTFPTTNQATSDPPKKTTKSWIWTSNTVENGDYNGSPTRHRRETEDTLSPAQSTSSSSASSTQRVEMESLTSTESATTVSHTNETENDTAETKIDELSSVINQGQLFGVLDNENGTEFIELNAMEENKSVMQTNPTPSSDNSSPLYTTVLYHKEPTDEAITTKMTKTTLVDAHVQNANSLTKEVFPKLAYASAKLNRSDRKMLPKPEVSLDIDNGLEEKNKMIEVRIHDEENQTKSVLFITTRRSNRTTNKTEREDGGGNNNNNNNSNAQIPKALQESLDSEPTSKPNRQRQLTRPQRRSFYPYFFSRVLG